MQRARCAESQTAATTMVLAQRCIRIKTQPALMAYANLGVLLPVSRIDAIRYPAGQHLRWLGAETAHRIGYVVDVVEDFLRWVDGSVDGQRIGAPDVPDLAAA